MNNYIPYPWSEQEIENYNLKNEERFGGLIVPFLGGAIIGSYFFPRPTYIPQYGYPIYSTYPINEQNPIK